MKFIEPGAAQHMAENVHALILYLSSTESPLKNLKRGHQRPPTFFFSTLGRIFVQYTFRTANTLHLLLFVSAVGGVGFAFGVGSHSGVAVKDRKEGKQKKKTAVKGEKPERGGKGGFTSNGAILNERRGDDQVRYISFTDRNMWIEQFKGVGLIVSGFIGVMIGANVWALVMSKVLKKGLSWFRVEYSCLWLYGPPTLAGAFSTITYFIFLVDAK